MELIQTGQKLSINIEKNNTLVEMLCTINKVYDDRIEVELPQYFMRYVECLDVGKHLTIKVFSNMGTIDFNTVVISSPLEDVFCIELDYNAMKFTPEEEIPKIEAVEKLLIKRKEEEFTIQTTEITTEEIVCVCDRLLELNENFDCELILPADYGKIVFKASVIKKDVVYDNEYTLSCYGMDENSRQTLLYYMYMYAQKYDQQV